MIEIEDRAGRTLLDEDGLHRPLRGDGMTQAYKAAMDEAMSESGSRARSIHSSTPGQSTLNSESMAEMPPTYIRVCKSWRQCRMTRSCAQVINIRLCHLQVSVTSLRRTMFSNQHPNSNGSSGLRAN